MRGLLLRIIDTDVTLCVKYCTLASAFIPLGGAKNGIAMTTAGDLPCKYIIHVAPRRRKDPSMWQKLVKKALDQAERAQLQSVAFPALGTGDFSFPAVWLLRPFFSVRMFA